jgi:hypothetical protein
LNQKKVEWKDAIFTVEVAETPFLGMLKEGKKPVQVEANWPVMKRSRGAIGGIPDGTPVSTVNHQGRRSLKGVSQWIREPWGVSHFANLTESYGVQDEAKFQKAEALLRLRLMMERLFLSTQDCAREGGGDVPAAANLLRAVGMWLEATEGSINSEYPIHADVRVAEACNYAGTLANFKDTSLEAMLIAAAKQRLRPATLDLHCGTGLKAHMDDWTQHDSHVTANNAPLQTYNAQAKDKTYLKQVDFFTFSAGQVRVHQNFNIMWDVTTGEPSAYTDYSGFGLDMSNGWEVRFMEKMKHSDLPYDGSGPRGVWDVTLLLACLMPAGQIRIKINS